MAHNLCFSSSYFTVVLLTPVVSLYWPPMQTRCTILYAHDFVLSFFYWHGIGVKSFLFDTFRCCPQHQLGCVTSKSIKKVRPEPSHCT